MILRSALVCKTELFVSRKSLTAVFSACALSEGSLVLPISIKKIFLDLGFTDR